MTKAPSTAAPNPLLNQILAALPAADYARLLPDLERVQLPRRWTMSESGDHVNYLHFPTSGIVSLIYALEDGSSSEIALVGNEGLIGISIYMGGESLPTSTEVQCAGEAYRLSRNVMKREFALGGQLQHLALLYTQALIVQTSQMAVCNQHHTVEQRFSRWILMSMDRLQGNKMTVTQEQISLLLGVRRESITLAAGGLQKDGIISYARGSITVVDRPHLEARACECYRAVKEECDRLLPHPHASKADASPVAVART
ncbi:Crp/Fnr family transcriptional regulator [Rhodoferax lacus]|uniref:Crp/Fnr family transcriptional regulator n=1 Tax=Rhodoferax lacus TaxID=2184758 RepID=UPI001F34B51C|nr:Crp/Fnr family transcriptional regulator [Rhodoferax lacus]